jgi:FixJ family two-component response regulator
MPGMNGLELKQRLDERNGSFPVIMISTRTEPDLEEKAISNGAICFLRKPFEVDVLVALHRESFEKLNSNSTTRALSVATVCVAKQSSAGLSGW